MTVSLTMIKSKISSKKLLGSGVTSKHTPTMHAMIITLRHASSNLLTDWNIQCAHKDRRDVLTTLLEDKKARVAATIGKKPASLPVF